MPSLFFVSFILHSFLSFCPYLLYSFLHLWFI
jgi:hypothetical protein